MQLIYLSTDEVNRSMVRRWGERRGVRVECPRYLDRAVAGPRDAIVLDLDHLPSGPIEGTIAWLEAAVARRRVAAHGYGPDQDGRLPRGLEVRPRLGSEFLREAASAAASSAPWPFEADPEELTWVDLD